MAATLEAGAVSGPAANGPAANGPAVHRRPAARWAIAVAAASLLVSVAAVVVALVLIARSAGVPGAQYLGSSVGDAAWAVAWLPYVVVGALVVPRHPRLITGWLLLAAGLLMTLENAINWLALYALRVEHTDPGPWLPWLALWLWIPAVVASTTILPLTFPDGRLPSSRWRPVAWTAVAAGVLMAMPGIALRPGLMDYPFPDVVNPVGLPGAAGDLARWIGTGPGGGRAVYVWLASVWVSFAAVILRFRRSRGVERQQLKWFLSAVTLFGPFVGLAVNYDRHPLLFALFGPLSVTIFAALAAAIGIAVLRHRLYDIDVVINRALVYGALTTLLALAYWGSVVLLQQALRPLTQGSELAVAASTLVVAALFQPLRGRIQAWVDRRFYRRKYDAQRTLEAFGARLREHVELDTLRLELLTAVQQTVRPARTSLWLRPPAERSP